MAVQQKPRSSLGKADQEGAFHLATTKESNIIYLSKAFMADSQIIFGRTGDSGAGSDGPI